MIDILLDTNIVIYLLDGHPTYLYFLRTLAQERVGISVMTYMETLIGAHDDTDARRMYNFLNGFEIVPLSFGIADACAMMFRKRNYKNLRHPQFADTIIGQTALSLDVRLATNNPKDFAAFRGLKTVVPG